MKYKIPQDRLDKIIFKYLDINLKGLEKKNAMFHVGFVFKYPDEQYGILGWENHGELYIKRLFVHEISSIFGLQHDDSKELIGRWASDRLQLEINNIIILPVWIWR